MLPDGSDFRQGRSLAVSKKKNIITTMKKIEITINGKAYPCRQTMGAMLRFKQETGKEITATDGGLSDMCTYLWCCVASACKVDGVPFDMPLIDFADSISPEDMKAWTDAVNEGQEPDGDEKKSW